MGGCITYSRLGILIHVCGVGGKRACATSADILEFRLGGVHARIGSARSLRSTLINYSKQPSLRGCIGKQMRTNDLNPSLQPAGLRVPMHIYDGRPGKGARRDACMSLSELERQHPGTPDEQSDTGRVTEPVAGGDSLFEQNEQGEAHDPVEVHHPAEK
jgi:hypothetical protein